MFGIMLNKTEKIKKELLEYIEQHPEEKPPYRPWRELIKCGNEVTESEIWECCKDLVNDGYALQQPIATSAFAPIRFKRLTEKGIEYLTQLRLLDS